MYPGYQKGRNRKGLLSEKGVKKKAWHVMKEFYKKNSAPAVFLQILLTSHQNIEAKKGF